MSDAYIFKSERNPEHPRQIPDERLEDAIGARLRFGFGPWRQRVIIEGEPGPWSEYLHGKKARGRLMYTLRTAAVGTAIGVESKRGARIRVRAVKLPPTKGQAVIDAGWSQQGAPYVFAAEDPLGGGSAGFDCSGFVKFCYESVGVTLPHAARLMQFDAQVVKFQDVKKARPGDLVLMHYPNERGIPEGTASHVGEFVRPGTMLDTRSPADPISLSPIEPESFIAYGRVVSVNGAL